MDNLNSVDLDLLASKLVEKMFKQAPVKSDWLNIKDAAIYLGVSVSHIRKAVYEGNLPANRSGKILIFRKSDLDNFILSK